MYDKNEMGERKNPLAFLDDPKQRDIIKKAGIAGLGIVGLVLLILIINSSPYPDELYIDSVAAPVSAQVKKIRMDRPYYNERVRKKTIDFYKRNDGKTRWLEYDDATKFYDAYVRAIREAQEFGLNPDHYELEAIVKEVDSIYKDKNRKPEHIAELDVRITASFLLFTTHLIEGRIRQAGYGDVVWQKNVPNDDDVELLLSNSSGKLSDVVGGLHPKHDQYEKLRDALHEYRQLAEAHDDSFNIAMTKAISPGDKHKAIPLIRKKLSITDIDSYKPDDSLAYDEKLVEGVKRFQKRHGLEADGIVSTATLSALNVSFKKKADLIELNLERLRWLPREFGDDYILINIPEYLLRLYEGGKEKMQMRVVLGTEYNATPVFSDTLEYIVFSPTWNVPASIMEEEFVPILQENPMAFDPERFKILHNGEEIDPADIDWKDDELNMAEFRMVENPGDMNSLGKVKFMMPNDFSIYLHDTPAEKLFKKNKRAYSHGCIRLESPVELAKFLLRFNDDKWTDDDIEEAMKAEEPVNVPLKKKYPVQIEYRTVWIDDDGLVHFREDVYAHDQRHIAMLNKMDSKP